MIRTPGSATAEELGAGRSTLSRGECPAPPQNEGIAAKRLPHPSHLCKILSHCIEMDYNFSTGTAQKNPPQLSKLMETSYGNPAGSAAAFTSRFKTHLERMNERTAPTSSKVGVPWSQAQG
jgi:hypothetical protein